MSDPQTAADPREGFDLRPLFAALWATRVRLLVLAIAAAAIAHGASFLIPKMYRASAVILPPEESDLLSNMSLAQRALTKFPRFGVLEDYFTPADTYKAILLSRTIQEQLAKDFDLERLYHLKSMEKTLKVLKGRYKVRLNPDGTIQISVDDLDRSRAAAMANHVLVLLDRFNVEKRNSSARRTREFLELRVHDTDSLLQSSEAALKKYQETHRAVAPTSIGDADVRGAADLMARKMALEVHLGVLRTYLSEDNEQVVQTRLELDQLGRQIALLPALENDLVRLTRDAKIQEQLYLLLTSELEQARLRETMDTPTVQVLDAASPPERQNWPKRLLLAAAAVVLVVVGQVVAIAAGLSRRAGASA